MISRMDMGCEGSSIKRRSGLAMRTREAEAGQSFLAVESSSTANLGTKFVCFCCASRREILGAFSEHK